MAAHDGDDCGVAGDGRSAESCINPRVPFLTVDLDIDYELIGQTAGKPRRTAAFQAVLELAAAAFHRTGANRGVTGGKDRTKKGTKKGHSLYHIRGKRGPS
jgi:hypothetical protein